MKDWQLSEIESIVNSRPISPISSDVNDLNALTPNHLLHASSGPSPPCLSQDRDNIARRLWKRIQYYANLFWSRWSVEYLALLQQRQKWYNRQRNVNIGDVVLIRDNAPRGSWMLGRVMKVVKDKKGLIRVVDVKTQSNVLTRPIHKLCVLLEAAET